SLSKANFESYSTLNKAASRLRDLSHKMRVSLAPMTLEAAFKEAAHHGIDLDMGWHESDLFLAGLMPELLKRGKEQAPFVVDFTDQLWIPATCEDIAPRKKYDFLLVDECQDLSKAQLQTVKKALKRG